MLSDSVSFCKHNFWRMFRLIPIWIQLSFWIAHVHHSSQSTISHRKVNKYTLNSYLLVSIRNLNLTIRISAGSIASLVIKAAVPPLSGMQRWCIKKGRASGWFSLVAVTAVCFFRWFDTVRWQEHVMEFESECCWILSICANLKYDRFSSSLGFGFRFWGFTTMRHINLRFTYLLSLWKAHIRHSWHCK